MGEAFGKTALGGDSGNDCLAWLLAGSWIAVELEKVKGADFARMVIASGRWSFPRVTLHEARALLDELGEHCRCRSCRPSRQGTVIAARQLEMF